MIKEFFIRRSVRQKYNSRRKAVLPSIGHKLKVLLITECKTTGTPAYLIEQSRTCLLSEQVQIICYNTHKKKSIRTDVLADLAPSSFNWRGKLPSETLSAVESYEYDLLINTGTQTDVYTDFIALSAKAGFKVSFTPGDYSIYDLQLVDTSDATPYEKFKNLASYLTALKGE